MQPTLLTPTTVAQGVDNHSWVSHCRCYCFCVCWDVPGGTFNFSCWLGQLSTVVTNDESVRVLIAFVMGVAEYWSCKLQRLVFIFWKYCIMIQRHLAWSVNLRSANGSMVTLWKTSLCAKTAYMRFLSHIYSEPSCKCNTSTSTMKTCLSFYTVDITVAVYQSVFVTIVIAVSIQYGLINHHIPHIIAR